MTEKATTPQAPRPRFGSMVDRETSRLTQLLVDSHTQILRGLSLLAPKARRSRVRWIIAAGFMAVIGALAADASSREFLTSKGRDFYRAHTAVAAVPVAPAPAPAVVPATAAVSPTTAITFAPVQVPTAMVASQTAEPTSPKEEGAPAVAQPAAARSNRAPKTRAPNRPRTAPAQDGT